MSDLVFRISHDLRAPMRAISSTSKWIVDDLGSDAPEGVKKSVVLLERSTRRLQTMLDGLLDLSRASSVVLSASASVRAAAEQAASGYVDDHRAVVSTTGDAQVAGELDTVRNVMERLFDNAVVHGGRDTVSIDVLIEVRGDMVHIDIRDDGAGFDPHVVSTAFDLFSTICPASQPAHVGVGLTVARASVEAHGGTVAVASVSPGGDLHLSWPAAEASEAFRSETMDLLR